MADKTGPDKDKLLACYATMRQLVCQLNESRPQHQKIPLPELDSTPLPEDIIEKMGTILETMRTHAQDQDQCLKKMLPRDVYDKISDGSTNLDYMYKCILNSWMSPERVKAIKVFIKLLNSGTLTPREEGLLTALPAKNVEEAGQDNIDSCVVQDDLRPWQLTTSSKKFADKKSFGEMHRVMADSSQWYSR